MNLCPQCEGPMEFNEDKDLRCFMCGKVLVLNVRRQYDSRRDKASRSREEESRRDMDRHSDLDRGNTRVISASDNGSTLVRQGNKRGRRRGNLTR